MRQSETLSLAFEIVKAQLKTADEKRAFAAVFKETLSLTNPMAEFPDFTPEGVAAEFAKRLSENVKAIERARAEGGIVIFYGEEYKSPWRMYTVATPSQRFAAFAIDAAIITIVTLSIMKLFDIPFRSQATSPAELKMAQYFHIGQTIIVWFYFVLMEASKWQGTIGKQIVGIKVVNEFKDPISIRQSFGRYGAKLLSTLMLGIGHLMMFNNPDRLTFHDKWARTRVIQHKT